jgi:phosphinothricin acetyltransferase
MALLIRLAGALDAAAIAAIYRPYVEDSRISFEEAAPDSAEMALRIAGELPGFHPWFVAEEDGGLLGYAASSPFRTRPAYRWTVETGIYLAPEAKGRGVGRALLTVLLKTLERQGYVAAIGAIALPNEASVSCRSLAG